MNVLTVAKNQFTSAAASAASKMSVGLSRITDPRLPGHSSQKEAKVDTTLGYTHIFVAFLIILTVVGISLNTYSENKDDAELHNVLFYIICIVIAIASEHKWVKKHIPLTFSDIILALALLTIFHALWVILVFASPTKPCELASTTTTTTTTTTSRGCNNSWLYHGPYPPVDTYDYSKYIYNVFVWFPPKQGEDDDSFKCQPCPKGTTASALSDKCNSGNVRCRECWNNERWISMKEIKDKHANGLLSKRALRKLGLLDQTNGKKSWPLNDPVSDPSNWPNFYTATTDDEPTQHNTGVCIPMYSKFGKKGEVYSSLTGGTCHSYPDCLSKSANYIDVAWPVFSKKTPKVLPGQMFEIRDVVVGGKNPYPIEFIVPNMKKGCPGPDDPRYSNDYNNYICKTKQNEKPNTCSIRIPMENIVKKRDGVMKSIRQGSYSAKNGASEKPCVTSNELIHKYNTHKATTRQTPNAPTPATCTGTGTVSAATPCSTHAASSHACVSAGCTFNAAEKGYDMKVDESEYDRRNILDMAREECQDTMGQCYMSKYVCNTTSSDVNNNNLTPIPLVSNGYQTIPEYSQEGCQHATNFCKAGETEGSSCSNAMIIDKDGYLQNTPGKCKHVKWNGTGKQWEKNTGSSNVPPRCIPELAKGNDFLKKGHNKTNVRYEDITDKDTGKVNSYKIREQLCKSVTISDGSKDNTNNFTITPTIYNQIKPCPKP